MWMNCVSKFCRFVTIAAKTNPAQRAGYWKKSIRILIFPAISIFIDIEIKSIIILILDKILIFAKINIQPRKYGYLLMFPCLLILHCIVKFFNIILSTCTCRHKYMYIYIYIFSKKNIYPYYMKRVYIYIYIHIYFL